MILLPIFISLAQMIQVKKKMSFMSIPTILREYRGSLLTQRDWFQAQYPHHRFIEDEIDNRNSILAFNRFEEEGHVERFHCHFRLVDLLRDALYALGTLTIRD